jgi:isopenicillin N synthase-like dioxygenase
LEKITEVVLKGMARSLNLEDGCFLEQYGKRAIMTARFNYYPKCPRPDLVLGIKPHADGSVITILLPDKEVEGLQFQKDNQWFGVPIISEALLINVGDQAEVTIITQMLSYSDRIYDRIGVYILYRIITF